ncbi:hypothetical protein EV121DRAFT_293175 [Schizophyllum commune]
MVRAGPPTVATVCAYWRSLALSTPSLWTDVHLFINYKKDLDDAAKLMRLLLLRSGDLPISVHIVRIREWSRETVPLVPLEALIDQCERWEHLRIYELLPSLCPHLRRAEGRLPRLRGFVFGILVVSYDFREADWAPRIRFLADCPRLESAEYSGAALVLPWHQLSRLVVRGPFTPEVLTEATQLRRLCFGSSEFGLLPGPAAGSVWHLPALRSVSVEMSYLRCIRAPALTECHIQQALEDQDLSDLVDLIRSNSPELTAL